jgi:hypothetical protein
MGRASLTRIPADFNALMEKLEAARKRKVERNH